MLKSMNLLLGAVEALDLTVSIFSLMVLANLRVLAAVCDFFAVFAELSSSSFLLLQKLS